MRPSQRAYEEKRATKAGVTLEESLQNKRPPDPIVQLIDDFIRTCDEYDKESDAASNGGYFQPTRKLQELNVKKLRLQEHLERVR